MAARNCIFCKIVAGEIPSYKVYEDEDFFAFLDIGPLNSGHTLVVPKKHFNWVHEVEPFGQYWEIAQRVAKAAVRALGADHVNFITLGYEVPHAHIHVIPRFPDDKLGAHVDWSKRRTIPKGKMQEIAAKMKKHARR